MSPRCNDHCRSTLADTSASVDGKTSVISLPALSACGPAIVAEDDRISDRGANHVGADAVLVAASAHDRVDICRRVIASDWISGACRSSHGCRVRDGPGCRVRDGTRCRVGDATTSGQVHRVVDIARTTGRASTTTCANAGPRAGEGGRKVSNHRRTGGVARARLLAVIVYVTVATGRCCCDAIGYSDGAGRPLLPRCQVSCPLPYCSPVCRVSHVACRPVRCRRQWLCCSREAVPPVAASRHGVVTARRVWQTRAAPCQGALRYCYCYCRCCSAMPVAACGCAACRVGDAAAGLGSPCC